ncbi:Basic leucine zipper (bZIP) transcription factor atfB [Penicillium verhagenii]|nr:Basic leucine zipper (bZIP) transcription factor atfB [Penicillium verhagenii]
MSTGNVNTLPTGLPISDPLNPLGASPFTATNAFAGEFLGLPMPDEEHLWGISPMSPTMANSGWDNKADAIAFANSALERDLKNSQVRNGQPTPPPYEDQYTRESSRLDVSSASKRRHAREYQTATDSLSPDLDPDEALPYQERAKRAKFLERNRLAASKCRQKKKEHTQVLEVRYKDESEKRERLVSEIARLRSEILCLKNEVLKHAQCGDEPIKLHLAHMVKKITDIDGPAPAASVVTVAATPHLDMMDNVTSPIAPTPTPTSGRSPIQSQSQAQPQVPSVSSALSFGFDDPLQLEPAAAAAAEAFEQQLRRDSETSLVTESSYGFPADDNFDELINV